MQDPLHPVDVKTNGWSLSRTACVGARGSLPWLGGVGDGKRGSNREKVRDVRSTRHVGTGEGGGFPGYLEATVSPPQPTCRHSVEHLFSLFWRWQEEPGPGVSPARGWGRQRLVWRLAQAVLLSTAPDARPRATPQALPLLP